jgi:FkbM family methyltransferase
MPMARKVTTTSGGFHMVLALNQFLAVKRSRSARILRNEGLLKLLYEILVYLSKPLRLAGESVAWRAYRVRSAKKSLSAQVMGHHMSLLGSDSGISKELALYGVHEPLATRVIKRLLQPGMNVLDIGSNLGYYALLEARAVGATGKVIAIEPVPSNARLLAANIEGNGYSNVLICEAAIGASECRAPIYLAGKSNWHSMVFLPDETGEKIEVPVFTVDSLVSHLGLSAVHLVRMDIEGYEVEALRGMQNTLRVHAPRLLVELHPHLVGPESIIGLLKELERMNYSVEYVLDRQRDDPWRAWCLHEEVPSLTELMRDTRITVERKALTVVFAKRGYSASCRTKG